MAGLIEVAVYDFTESAVTTHCDDPVYPSGQSFAGDLRSLTFARRQVFGELNATVDYFLTGVGPGSQRIPASRRWIDDEQELFQSSTSRCFFLDLLDPDLDYPIARRRLNRQFQTVVLDALAALQQPAGSRHHESGYRVIGV